MTRLAFVIRAVALLLALALAPAPAPAGDHEPTGGETAILLAAFGTSRAEARPAYDNIHRLASEAFPKTSITWCYTSAKVRRILAGRGQAAPSAARALAELAEAGAVRVAVQSLHVIPGAEFHELLSTVAGFREAGLFERITVGAPLLASEADLEHVSRLLAGDGPAEDEAHLYMGHGSRHPGNVFYPALQYHLSLLSPRVFVGTVEGSPQLGEIIPALREAGVKRVRLAPLMVVAGTHAEDDMAGDEPDSWKSRLESGGFAVETDLAGLGESDGMAGIFIEHLRLAVEELQ